MLEPVLRATHIHCTFSHSLVTSTHGQLIMTCNTNSTESETLRSPLAPVLMYTYPYTDIPNSKQKPRTTTPPPASLTVVHITQVLSLWLLVIVD